MDSTAPGTLAQEGRGGRTQRFAANVTDRTVSLIAGTDMAMREAGLTKDDGRISKRKLAMAALRPRSSGVPIVRAAAAEVERVRQEPRGAHFRRIV